MSSNYQKQSRKRIGENDLSLHDTHKVLFLVHWDVEDMSMQSSGGYIVEDIDRKVRTDIDSARLEVTITPAIVSYTRQNALSGSKTQNSDT